jgi:Leucine-rich repeat (LRR) protein
MARPKRRAGAESGIDLGPRPGPSRRVAIARFCYDTAIVQKNLSEAERRIEEARRLQATWLDLGDLALNEIPAELEDLAHLRILSLGKMKVTEAGEFESVSERGPSKLKDLTLLAPLEALERLDLSRTGVTDLSPLSGLQGLQRLDLSSTGVTDLSPLSGLQRLQSLELRFTPGVTDLSPLPGSKGFRASSCRPPA